MKKLRKVTIEMSDEQIHQFKVVSLLISSSRHTNQTFNDDADQQKVNDFAYMINDRLMCPFFFEFIDDADYYQNDN